MEQKAFDYLKKSEESWWWKGRSYAILKLLSKFAKGEDNAVFDMGSGFGSMFPILSRYGKVTAFDTYQDALEVCKQQGYSRVLSSESEFASLAGQFEIVGAFDVIEHVDDDHALVSNIFSLLKSGGLLFATVPAYQFLWSEHDVEHHHFRRHTKTSMKKLLEGAGFEMVYKSYWNFSLLPVAYILRKLGKGGGENLTPNPVINNTLSALLWLESRVIPYLSLPWGISVIVVARRP